MPPKIILTKEKIAEAAFQLVRVQGHESLSARVLAGELGCSTHPIYRAYTTMEELTKDVMAMAEEAAAEYMENYEDPDGAFLGIGMGYLDFARVEPELFRLLYLSGKRKFEIDHLNPPLSRLYEKMRRDSWLEGMDESVLARLFRDMWLYTHGLNAMISQDRENWTEEKCRALLHDMGHSLIVYENVKDKVDL